MGLKISSSRIEHDTVKDFTGNIVCAVDTGSRLFFARGMLKEEEELGWLNDA